MSREKSVQKPAKFESRWLKTEQGQQFMRDMIVKLERLMEQLNDED